ncbi:major capsid protein [Xylophilus ampelinus]|uniref:Virion coat protein B n=1 Tax=Xylophilus ampelinus TaxID=54067 RepID=A0A318SKQ0_9BURK|nr:major capsid protein [Xylophilus ampelinus]MCS4509291.1 major capsid protein [Xylophilus ampelinus]PYE79683.1 hypothetical protein DFQ15_1012 [Xylophilus ampelinus]
MFASSRSRIAAIAAAPLALVGTAQAAVPAGVTTAMTDLQTDGLAIVSAIMGAMIAIWGLKKLASKFGWA